MGILTVALSIVLIIMSVSANSPPESIQKFSTWLLANRHPIEGLPYSHVGDTRFKRWSITYDSAVVALAYIAIGRIEDAKRIVDFYIDHASIKRLGGIVEANIADDLPVVTDWSIRAGANIWMGLASTRLYVVTKEKKYLAFGESIADFTLSLQNKDPKDSNFGGVALGPKGDPRFDTDQHLGYDKNGSEFISIYATEISIDAFALFNMLDASTLGNKYLSAREDILRWLKNNAVNEKEDRLNRGYDDSSMSSDIQSWGVSALGVNELNRLKPDLAKNMIRSLEKECISKINFRKPDGSAVTVKGVDFIDHQKVRTLKRQPLISFEWTYQLINAYARLSHDLMKIKNPSIAKAYQTKRQELIDDMLRAAIVSPEGLTYPYASQADAVIGHEYKTPGVGNYSAIGVAYAILALSGMDPLNLILTVY